MKKKIISLAVVVLLAVSYLTVLAVADTGIEAENGVITAELQSVMDSATATAKIPVSIWTTEIDTAVVEEIALAKSGYNKDSIRALVDQGKIDTVTLEDVDKYIAAERRIYAQMQTQAHQAFVNDYAFLKKASTAEGAYICSYAPMMIVELTTSQIETLAKDSDVNTMYYAPESESCAAINVGAAVTKADYVRDTGGLSGNNIKIGMIEKGTIPESTAVLPSGHVTIQTGLNVPDDHSTMVAEIILSNGSYKGIVPDANLYCTAFSYFTNMCSRTEWLLSQNVHIINMSFGYTNDFGVYNFIDKWVDHIANSHSVHVVVAAGNVENLSHPYHYVMHPAIAYNVVTVGNLDDKNTAMWNDDEINPSSCYQEVYVNDVATTANKPDLVAPGTDITTSSGYTNTGTSFAAPHVAGIMAQLIQQMPALATLQDLMKAILTASISHSEHQYDSNDANFDIYGAGVVNAQDCTYTNYRGTFASSSFSSSEYDTYKEYTFTATNTDTQIRVSLAWIKNVLFSSSNAGHVSLPDVERELADLDLVIIAPNGAQITLSADAKANRNSNLEILQFNPATYGYGTYKVRVYINESTGARTYFGLAWW
ncbi:MAG: S8 family serine peptidase [Clostridia bacterium]|nr:S8 family serine peptidase [Clostridia bacterium]